MNEIAAIKEIAATVPRAPDGGEARLLLEGYGVTFAPWRIVDNVEAALSAALSLGYPVAVKTAAPDVPHKSDVGCVRIGISDPEALRAAAAEIASNARRAGSASPDLMLVERMTHGVAEIVIGLKRSETFGATILVGMGGIWVELMRDFALRLCPVDSDTALEMLRDLRGLPMLTGGRGRPPADLEALSAIIVGVSRLGAARDDFVELDLNPVMVMAEGQGAYAIDARIALDGSAFADAPGATATRKVSRR